MHERPSMNATFYPCLCSSAFGWVGVVWLLLSQLYDLVEQLSFDTWDSAGLSHFVLIFGQADLFKFCVFVFPAGGLAGKARSKVFEMNGTDSDQMLVLHSVPFF